MKLIHLGRSLSWKPENSLADLTPPPDTLHQLVMGLQGHLRLKGNHVTVLHDVIFKPVRDALDYRMKMTTELGLGHKKQAPPVTLSLEEKMWQNSVLGDDTPAKLLHTIMYLLGTQFALRASDHKALNIDEQLQVSFPSINIIIFVYFIVYLFSFH